MQQKAILNQNISNYNCLSMTGTIIKELDNFYVFMPDKKTQLQSAPTFKGCIFLKSYFNLIYD